MAKRSKEKLSHLQFGVSEVVIVPPPPAEDWGLDFRQARILDLSQEQKRNLGGTLAMFAAIGAPVSGLTCFAAPKIDPCQDL